MSDDTLELNPVELATELTIAWLANPNTRTNADDVPAFLNRMYETVSVLVGGNGAAAESEAVAPEYTPAVTARKSLASQDHIISMIDGKKYKTLRRHLATNGMTPQEYRERYGLKADYPMVAPSYSEARRTMAKSIGLGRKPGQSATPKADAPAAKPAPRKRKTEEATAE
ncbi:MucR family transcriptional regulator [Sphingomonas faeni]|uniref:MucR family transcriptional regulator n=1 Tax=Sphingomonas faeni TaxID=185950 RepID=UPI0024130D6D|nr:MucR family transcriptional regulator [Sphingomonas faeni]